MKRIYQNNDLIINLSVCDFPINKNMINSIEFKFFTINPSNCIVKSHNDINEHNQVLLQWDELKNLEEGVLFYDYKISLVNNELNDGTKDTIKRTMTDSYIVSSINNIVTDEYYTKDEINDLIDNLNSGEVDLTNYYKKDEVDNKLNGKASSSHTHTEYASQYQLYSMVTKSELSGYSKLDHTHTEYVTDDVLGSYYTKSEVNELIDNIDIPTGETPTVDLSNYYTKDEVNDLIPSTEGFIKEIPSEYVTETELNDKGYITEHQSLEGYAKLSDIPTDYIKSIPSEYITETELNEKGYITTQYDDTEVLNRISALESEISGVTQQINELNGMIV